MTRGVARYLVGSLVVLGLAACGKVMFAERDPWRHEAEVACLKSGLVKESPALARVQPISGPGVCGADFPIKVAAIGEGSPIGYEEEVRPPGAIPGRQPLANPQAYTPRPVYSEPYRPQQQYPAAAQYQYPPPQQYPQQAYPQQAYPQSAAPNGPISLRPPGVAPAESDDDAEYEPEPDAPVPAQPGHAAQPHYRAAPDTRQPGYQSYPPQTYPTQPAEQVPLGTPRGMVTSGATMVQPAATLACPIVSALDTWFASGVQPAAMRWFGQPVAEIRQISAYSCRGMNGQRGAPISEHAFGNALDIASFTLADGRKISVKDGWRGLPEEQGFLRDVQGAACRQFSTVLAPGSNAFHYDHIHVDLARRASGRQVCNPAAVPGDVVAARAGSRYGQRGDSGITGSIKQPRARSFRTIPGRDEVYDRLPPAVPGED
jgi:hypothetical protein